MSCVASIDCHSQATPSISSYSAIPLRQSSRNTPARVHSWKYLCTQLEHTPSRSRVIVSHWHPVRSTLTIALNTLRRSALRRPPPGFLLYCLSGSRSTRTGSNGSTISHNLSDIIHGFILAIDHIVYIPYCILSNFIYG